jgi:hypothetical protein
LTHPLHVRSPRGMQGRFARLVAAVVGVTVIACGSNDLAAPPGSATEDTPGMNDTPAITALTTSVAPWRNEDFTTYGGSTNTWKLDPHDWMVSPSSWMHTEKIVLDTKMLYNGHPTLRYDWPGPAAGKPWGGCNTDPAISASYKMPAAREVWIEVVHKFRSDWNDRGPGCGFGEYKFLLPLRAADRMGGIGNGHLGSSWWSSSAQSPVFSGFGTYCSTGGVGENCQWGYGSGQSQYLASIPGKHWDGLWHTYRVHVRFPAIKGEKTGTFEIWVDGVKVLGRYNRTFINASNGYFSPRFVELMLGSNSNSGTLVATQTWWGHLKIWTTSPGW